MSREIPSNPDTPHQWSTLADAFTVISTHYSNITSLPQEKKNLIASDYAFRGFDYLTRTAKRQYMKSAARDMRDIIKSGEATVLLVDSIDIKFDTLPSKKVETLINLNDGLYIDQRPQFIPKKTDGKSDKPKLLLPERWITETTRTYPAEAVTFLAAAGAQMRDILLINAKTEYSSENSRAPLIASELLFQAKTEIPYSSSASSFQDGVYSMLSDTALDMSKVEKELTVFLRSK